MTIKEKMIMAITEWKIAEMKEVSDRHTPQVDLKSKFYNSLNYSHVKLVDLRFDTIQATGKHTHEAEYEVLIHTFSLNEEVTVELAIIKGLFSAGLVLLSETYLSYHPIAGTQIRESFQKSAHDYGISNTFNEFGYADDCLMPLADTYWELLKEELASND
ncbi:hypothetical protein CN918_30190 [Priestia megaterium]|nr:hypothetical protein CN918_30190 [Priestia megaterium]